jgi:hypothetical protein
MVVYKMVLPQYIRQQQIQQQQWERENPRPAAIWEGKDEVGVSLGPGVLANVKSYLKERLTSHPRAKLTFTQVEEDYLNKYAKTFVNWLNEGDHLYDEAEKFDDLELDEMDKIVTEKSPNIKRFTDFSSERPLIPPPAPDQSGGYKKTKKRTKRRRYTKKRVKRSSKRKYTKKRNKTRRRRR